MRAPPGDAGGSGASDPTVSADEPGLVEANDFHRGVRATTDRRPALWTWSSVGRSGSDRPTRWYASPLVLVAVLGGLMAFSTAWTVVGGAVVAISIATIVGVCAGSRTVVAGTLVWTRLAERPAAPGY